MTDEQIRIAIHEAVGWTDCGEYPKFSGSMILGGHRPGTPRGCWTKLPPLTLDAMAEAEATLTDAQTFEYDRELDRLTFDPDRSMLAVQNYAWHATARQRAAAFLAVKGAA